ncbi:hypothetical protein V1J52_09840 [Streptomyces sp. TRM 70351]|uniref:hypothetical protein n=1 Tax=Streptomyces sp. TRM 70351 TaxID=3116552 RepID=UPI002E7BA8AC|nr:hypothetical protein [Streptomyces sp. TRM 70351]MEE1928489.1 hypothetical protein [Streptomyces sp. TRM 70351]
MIAAAAEASGPHGPAALLGALAAAATAAAVGVVFLCSSWAQRGGPPGGVAARSRDLAVACAAGAAACYAWGVLRLAYATGDAPFDACLPVVGRDRMQHVSGYGAEWFPLGLTCVLPGGQGPAVGVPGYVNPAVTVLACVAAAAAVFAAAHHLKNKPQT